jgi:PKD repeat protein
VSGGPTVCAPVADFYYTHDMVCENGTVQFYDLSSNGQVTSWNWSFPGGNPSTSTDSAPLVTYPTAGLYDVTLTVTNGTGSDTKTRTSNIRVSGATTETIPFSEGFESGSTFPTLDGFVQNPDNGTTWSRVTNTYKTGTAAIKINNYTNSTGQVDEWILPSFDFSNVTTPITMSFYVANAQRNSTSADKLELSASANCGSSYQLRWSKYGASLATAGVVSTNFTPVAGSATQWRAESTNLNAFKLLPNVRLKFTNTSDRGNNIYIDDINITGTLVNVDEAEEVQLGFAIYPNPTSESSTVEFQLSKDQNVTVEVKDIMGRTVAILAKGQLNAGYHTFNTPSLSKGIYMIDLISGNKHHVRRLIVS